MRQSTICSAVYLTLLGAALALSASAADFEYSKQTYVPPTRYQRRLDYESLRERAAATGSDQSKLLQKTVDPSNWPALTPPPAAAPHTTGNTTASTKSVSPSKRPLSHQPGPAHKKKPSTVHYPTNKRPAKHYSTWAPNSTESHQLLSQSVSYNSSYSSLPPPAPPANYLRPTAINAGYAPSYESPPEAANHVSELSAFMIALRNQALAAKQQQRYVEATTHQMMQSSWQTPVSPTPASVAIISQPVSNSTLAPSPAEAFVPTSTNVPYINTAHTGQTASPPATTQQLATRHHHHNQITRQSTIYNWAPPIIPATSLVSTLPTNTQAYSLLLKDSRTSSTYVQFTIALTNNSNSTLRLPAHTMATIRAFGYPDQKVKINFPVHYVSAYGTTCGTARIPKEAITPTADLVITDLPPVGTTTQYAHLPLSPTAMASR